MSVSTVHIGGTGIDATTGLGVDGMSVRNLDSGGRMVRRDGLLCDCNPDAPAHEQRLTNSLFHWCLVTHMCIVSRRFIRFLFPTLLRALLSDLY